MSFPKQSLRAEHDDDTTCLQFPHGNPFLMETLWFNAVSFQHGGLSVGIAMPYPSPR